MRYTVELAPAARRQLKKLDPPIQKRIFRRLKRLENQPRPKSAIQLQGATETFFRIREGDWRIIYTIENERLIVLVVRIAHRSSVYR